MTEHTVKSYDQELHDLARLVTEMGALAERQIRDSMGALVRRGPSLADRVVATDDAVDDLQRRIEALTVLMIGKRQPMASDLRDIVAALPFRLISSESVISQRTSPRDRARSATRPIRVI